METRLADIKFPLKPPRRACQSHSGRATVAAIRSGLVERLIPAFASLSAACYAGAIAGVVQW